MTPGHKEKQDQSKDWSFEIEDQSAPTAPTGADNSAAY
jgi:hypothetical protein